MLRVFPDTLLTCSMKSLASLNKYFFHYKWKLLPGLLFVAIANLFAVLSPGIVRNVLDDVLQTLDQYKLMANSFLSAEMRHYIFRLVLLNGLLLLAVAGLRGFFLFLMRQTIIVTSRHIEYDQKNEIYGHYQKLDMAFFRSHTTGDMMNRVSEDVSRVRMYTGPCIMYAANLVVLTVFSVWGMARVDPWLTMLVVLPLPLLAGAIYAVNKIIYRKSSSIQEQLSSLTATAQESYSGIRVIRSFVQEKHILRFFGELSNHYRKSTINLALTEAVYFPSMSLFIGLSMLVTIFAGGYLVMHGAVSAGNIAEFIMYINMLLFPVSSIGWVASMSQRAAASQKRIDEFLHTEPAIKAMPGQEEKKPLSGMIDFVDIGFTYPHTGIKALKKFNLHIRAGSKVAIIGKTGSGKSTITHLLLRMYDPESGQIYFDGMEIRDITPVHLREQIACVPQDPWLFSDTIANNIRFGNPGASLEAVIRAAEMADIAKDIALFPQGYETVVGERGVLLSGGQKQRIVLARALLKDSPILILDESLSAVDTQTEKRIQHELVSYLKNRTTLVITHRIFTAWEFDEIVVLEDGSITEQGTHAALLEKNGYYAWLFRHQADLSRE